MAETHGQTTHSSWMIVLVVIMACLKLSLQLPQDWLSRSVIPAKWTLVRAGTNDSPSILCSHRKRKTLLNIMKIWISINHHWISWQCTYNVQKIPLRLFLTVICCCCCCFFHCLKAVGKRWYCKSRIFRRHVIFVYFVRGGFRTKIKCTQKVQSKSENPQRSATVRKFHVYERLESPRHENWVRTKYSGFTVNDTTFSAYTVAITLETQK